jgi:major vault protein
MFFEDNGMRVTDVEVLDITIQDGSIAKMLSDSQRRTVQQNIELSQAEKDLKVKKRTEEIEQDKVKAEQQTAALKSELQIQRIGQEQKVQDAQAESQKSKVESEQALEKLREGIKQISFDADLERRKQKAIQETAEKTSALAIDKERLAAETKAVVDKFTAAQPAFAECILALSNAETLEKIAKAHSVGTLIGGESVVDSLKKIFGDGMLADGLTAVTQRMRVPTMASPRV